MVVTGGVVLLVGVGSFVGGPTLAMLVTEPVTGAVTVTVRFVTWLLLKFAMLQVKMPLLVTPFPLALTKVTFAGNVSVTMTLVAADGPKFVTAML